MEILEYEQVVAEFESKLVTRLRKFGTDAEYLEMWVPDANPVTSILNMVESAEAFGQDEIAVRVTSNTMPPDRINELIAQIGKLGKVVVTPAADKIVIAVTEIGS